jgi:hypothetical protein
LPLSPLTTSEAEEVEQEEPVVRVEQAPRVFLASPDSRENPEKRALTVTDNGSEGRFLRIESKLDAVAGDVGDLRVAVARIEESLHTETRVDATRVSENSFKWMKWGIVISFSVGALSLLARILGVGI